MPEADLSEFYKYASPKKAPCRIAFVLKKLKPAERINLEAALLEDKGIINAGAITEWLSNHGCPEVSTGSVSAHRRGICSCRQDS